MTGFSVQPAKTIWASAREPTTTQQLQMASNIDDFSDPHNPTPYHFFSEKCTLKIVGIERNDRYYG